MIDIQGYTCNDKGMVAGELYKNIQLHKKQGKRVSHIVEEVFNAHKQTSKK